MELPVPIQEQLTSYSASASQEPPGAHALAAPSGFVQGVKVCCGRGGDHAARKRTNEDSLVKRSTVRFKPPACAVCAVLLILIARFSPPTLAALLQIDPGQSGIEVAVKSTAASFIARLEKYQAVIEFQSTQELPSKADLSFDFKDLKTGVQGRDSHMLHWLEYSKNPTASFHLKTWHVENGQAYAVGELTIHAVQREIRLPVVVKHQGETYDIQGSTELDHRDFGLPKIRQALLFTVDPHLKIKFHLVGRLDHPQ